MEIDSSSQPTSGPLNGLHRQIPGEGDGSRLREMLEGVDMSLKRSRPLDFVSSASDAFLDVPVTLKRSRIETQDLPVVTTTGNHVTSNRSFEASYINHLDGATTTTTTRRQCCEGKVNHMNDLNAAPIFRSVLFGESSSRFQHLNEPHMNSASPTLLRPDNDHPSEQVSQSATLHAAEVTNHEAPTDFNPPTTTIDNPTVAVISSSDPFHDLTGDLSLQVCTSLDEIPPANHDPAPAERIQVNEEEEEEEEKNEVQEDSLRERRQSARMAAVKMSKQELKAERKRLKEEEKEEKRKKRAENQEKKRLKALEVAERKRLRQEEKIRKAAEIEERKKIRAIELAEKKKKKEEEEELKKKRKEELQERLRLREEEREQLRQAKAKKDEENKQKAAAKKRKKAADEEVEEGEDGWKKNAGLTMEDRAKIPLGPMSGVERVFSWLFGKHSDSADLPPYLHMNEDANRSLPQVQAETTLTESQSAQKE